MISPLISPHDTEGKLLKARDDGSSSRRAESIVWQREFRQPVCRYSQKQSQRQEGSHPISVQADDTQGHEIQYALSTIFDLLPQDNDTISDTADRSVNFIG